MNLRAVCLAVVSVVLMGVVPGPARADQRWETTSMVPQKTRAERIARLVRLLTKDGYPTEAEIRKVGQDVDSLLSTIANDPNTSQYLRVKGIWCLRYFRNRRSQLLLRSVVTDSMWQKPFRIVAMVSMAHVDGAASFEVLKDLCVDSDADVRLACVDALDVIGGDEVASYLRALIAREREMSVLQRMDQVIRRHSGLPQNVE